MADTPHRPVYEVDGKMVDADGNEVSAKEAKQAKADAAEAADAAEKAAENAPPPAAPVVAAVPVKAKRTRKK